jgi:hypothetical protein
MTTARRTCGLRLARTLCRFPCLNEEFLEIAYYRRVALRQFRRDLVPQRKQIFLGLSTVRGRRFATSRTRLKKRLLVSAARP